MLESEIVSGLMKDLKDAETLLRRYYNVTGAWSPKTCELRRDAEDFFERLENMD